MDMGGSVSVHGLLALLLFTLSSQCPIECGHVVIATVSVLIHLFPVTKPNSSDTLLVSLIILLAGDMEQRERFFQR